MKIQDMHYDFKKKLNKVDSEQYKNLIIPEIDWVLNEAQEIFIKSIIDREYFEAIPRNIDEIRTLIVETQKLSIDDNKVELPTNYWRFLSGEVDIEKGTCKTKSRLYIRDYGEEFQESTFDKSSFEWRVVNGLFQDKSLILYTDGTFTISGVYLDYVKQPEYIHNAADFNTNGYKLPSGEQLTGTRDSILPSYTHRKIVDIAVLIVKGEIESPNYKLKEEKLKLA